MAKQERLRRLANAGKSIQEEKNVKPSAKRVPIQKPQKFISTGVGKSTKIKRGVGRPRKVQSVAENVHANVKSEELPEVLPIASSPNAGSPQEPQKWVDPDTSAVVVRRTAVGPVEARSRWWLFSNTATGIARPGRRSTKKESSPPRPLTADLLDTVAVFRLIGRSFEQMGNRLIKTVIFWSILCFTF